MPFPIRYRFLDKETRKVVKFDDKEYFLLIDSNGIPVLGHNTSYYPSFSWESCSKYILEVATEKDWKGQWIYKQLGF